MYCDEHISVSKGWWGVRRRSQHDSHLGYHAEAISINAPILINFPRGTFRHQRATPLVKEGMY